MFVLQLQLKVFFSVPGAARLEISGFFLEATQKDGLEYVAPH